MTLGTDPSGTATTTASAKGTPQRGFLRRAVRENIFPVAADIAILGGGCAGLATAVALHRLLPDQSVVVLDGRTGPDPRTWCFWDQGENPVPEAVTGTWDQWEIRTSTGTSIGSDPHHPYRMIHAADYRQAMTRRLTHTGAAATVAGLHIADVRQESNSFVTSTALGTVTAPTTLDGRGPAHLDPVPEGRTRLQQRFLGLWVHTTKPVFDTSTVTLMDFTVQAPNGPVQFMYVLPVSPTDALVECTEFRPDSHGDEPFRNVINSYLTSRWGLQAHEWEVTAQEAGNIPMTDTPPARGSVPAIGVRAGATRPSTGYAFTRIQQHATRTAEAIRDGSPVPLITDSWRTRLLDAIFLRFLRDQPEHAPDTFQRLFGRLPGPLTVRFLTEHSTVLDELRIIAVLPKRRFIRAAWTTFLERLRLVPA
ncbi:lycopene cyclase family protein [Frondihabitans peucedani]